jgi:curved DNA-binding protein
MEYKDYYKIMGIKRDATQDEVKRAYRRLARKYHPDVSKEPEAERKFKEVNEANEVLADPQKRAAYDQLGSDWNHRQDFRPPPGWGSGFEFHTGSSGDAQGFSDFFESLFGRPAGGYGSYRGYQRQGEDQHAKITVDLADSYHGATRSVSLQVPQRGADGRTVKRTRTLKVRIPKGIRQGQQIRLAGQGLDGVAGGRAGDLYLEVGFKLPRQYRVEEADVYLDLPVAPWEAALGATVKITTPSGNIDVKIPANSQAGKKLRLKGRGIPARNPGDLYLVLQVVLPPANDEKGREIYRRMQAEMAFNPRADLAVH